MIHVTIKTSEDEESIILLVKGHSGQADKGQDIICASASMLVFALAQCVTDMEKAMKLRKKPTIKIEDGNAIIIFKPQKDFYSEAYLTAHTIKRGFDLLCHNFPEFVAFADD